MKQSQIYVAAWLFPLENDLKSSRLLEKRSAESLLPRVIMLTLNN